MARESYKNPTFNVYKIQKAKNIKMKKIPSYTLLILLSFLSTNCIQERVMNRVVKYDYNGQTERLLVGEFDKNQLNGQYFKDWYEPEYNDYKVDEALSNQLKKYSKKYTIDVFMGTWCPDSKREVPALIKILETIKFPDGRVNFYGLNRDKKSFYGEELNKDVRYVPTIIVYEKRKEIGRIVESPVSGSLEEDLLMIFSKTPLEPNYSEK